MAFIVRSAVREDAPAIAEVHVQSWRATYAHLLPGDFLDRLSVERRLEQWRVAVTRNVVFVAEDERGLFGFASGGPAQELPGFGGELYTLYLRPDAQKRGAGRALVGAVAAGLERLGHGDLALWVLRDNPSRGFYERLGGEPVAEKDLMIGGVTLKEVAFGWRPIGKLTAPFPDAR